MRRFRNLITGVVLAFVGCALLTGCDREKVDPAFQPGADGSTMAGNSLIGTGSPWGMIAGLLVNVVASTFISKGVSKSTVVADNLKDYNADEAHNMADALRKAGYDLKRTP